MNQTGMACFRASLDHSRNTLIPYYLMASYAYYHLDESLLDDATFDQITKDLQAEWDSLSHMHKHVINRDDLSAGTCLLPRDAFPTIVKSAACRMLNIPLPQVDIDILLRRSATPSNPVVVEVSAPPEPVSAPPPNLPPARVRVRTRPAA